MSCKKCATCAWFCHADGKCYGTEARLIGICMPKKPKTGNGCGAWTSDGLEDWERKTLMTVEEAEK